MPGPNIRTQPNSPKRSTSPRRAPRTPITAKRRQADMSEGVRDFSDLKTTLIKAKQPEQQQVAAAQENRPKLDRQGRAYATGKRKNAVARVWLKPGPGRVMVNG